MPFYRSLPLKLCLGLLAFVPAAAPAAAPVLSASPGAVDFQFASSQPLPQPVFVTVTASDGSTPAVTFSLAAAAGTPAGLFGVAPAVGATFQVGIDPNTLYSLLNQPAGVYGATVTVTAPGFAPLAVPVSLAVNTNLSFGASPAFLMFNPPVGPTVQTVSITGPAVNFIMATATATGGSWLSVTTSASFTPATLTVTVAPQNLAAGVYAGSITLTPSVGLALVIPVTLQVGTETFAASPSLLAFNYTLGGTTPPSQPVQLTSTIANNTYSAQVASSGNWLLVNGVTANASGTLPATLNVSVNPTGLAAGTYQGSITVTDGHASTETITATLVVSGIALIANPSSLSFVMEEGQAAPPEQTLAITTGPFTATSTQAWLSVFPTNGQNPGPVTVTVNPAGLAPGTYSGIVQVGIPLHTQNVPVTLVVSANPVLTTEFGEITFTFLGGNPSPPPFTIDVNVSSGAPQVFSFATGVPSWLQVTSSATTTPAVLSVKLVPQSLPSGTYLADIILIPAGTGGIPVTVPVLLTVVGATPILSYPASLTFNAPAGNAPLTQTVQITAATTSTFTAVASSTSGNWLSVTPPAGTATIIKTPLTVTADPTGLAQGTYQGIVTLTTNLGVVTQVPVTFNVGTGVPITVSPSTLAFQFVQNGSVPAAQSVQVTASQSFTATAATTLGGAWLSVTPTTGATNTSLSVSVNPAGLAPALYNGTVTVTPASGVAQTVAVTLTVTKAATLAATPNSLAFAYTSGNPNPAAQNLSVTSTGTAVAFSATTSSSGWLSVTPVSGTTPATLSVAVNPANLGTGSYSGSISLNGGSAGILQIGVTLTVTKPFPAIQRVVNSASYQIGGIAPGEIVVVFGSSLGPDTGVGATVDSRGFIGTSLANVQVTFNGYAAPILYAGSGQINAIVPYELAGAANASVVVTFGSARSNSVTLPVVSSAPGIYSASATGTGGGAILDANYHLVSSSNPVGAGDIIQVFGTGQGQTTPAGVDGLIEPLSLPLPALLLAPAARIGGIPATIDYIGAAPGLVAGALQVNVVIPPGLPSGPASLVLMIGDNGSQNGITVAIK